LVLSAVGEIPTVPKNLLRVTVESWEAYWQSEAAQLTKPEHRPIVERLFIRRDERERAYRTVRKQGRVAKGSQGQPVQHPLLKYIDACDQEIRALEASLGVSPQALLRLGAALTTPGRTLDDINRTSEEDDDDQDDPRLRAIQ
jgi:P27 family predicted phage terminase small subunit